MSRPRSRASASRRVFKFDELALMRLLIHYLSGYHRALIVSAQKDFEKKGRKRKKKKTECPSLFQKRQDGKCKFCCQPNSRRRIRNVITDHAIPGNKGKANFFLWCAQISSLFSFQHKNYVFCRHAIVCFVYGDHPNCDLPAPTWISTSADPRSTRKKQGLLQMTRNEKLAAILDFALRSIS